MIFQSTNDFLDWVFDKNNIVYTYDVDSSDFVSKSIHTINFQSSNSTEVYSLRCPIRKKDNANFLRIVRKVIFEIKDRTVITYNLKDFLNFIPGSINVSSSKIYDVQLLESILRVNIDDIPQCRDLMSRLKLVISKLNQTQIKLYDIILLPSAFLYSKIEKSGLPTQYDTKLYSYYNLNGTVSGRLTNCSFDSIRFINPLNISKDRREIIQAPSGYKLITADYNAMEMRVLAYITQEPKLLEIFEHEEEDIYRTIGKDIFQIENVDNKIRQTIKDMCFLVIYGGTEFGFAKRQNCSVQEASIMIRKFFDIFPTIEEWSLQTQIALCEHGSVESIFGRKRFVDIKEDGNSALRQGQNFLIQSPANDITMSVMQELDDNILEGSRILIHLHDSITILTPESKVEGNKKIIYDVMKSPQKIKNFSINNIRLFPVLEISKNWW